MRSKIIPSVITANPLIFGGLAVVAVIGYIYLKGNSNSEVAAPVDNTNYTGLGYSAPVGYGLVSGSGGSSGYSSSVTNIPVTEAAATTSSGSNSIDALLAAAAVKELRDYTLQLETIKLNADSIAANATLSAMSIQSNNYIASLMATSSLASSIIASGKPLTQGGISGPNGVNFDFNILQVQPYTKADKNNTVNKLAVSQYGAYVPPVVQPMPVSNYGDNAFVSGTSITTASIAEYTPPANIMQLPFNDGSRIVNRENDNIREQF